MYFADAAAFRAWLAAHHADRGALLVGFHKRGTGVPSMTWPESVDAALCYGWIDGVRRRVDDERYTIRFSPRRARSVWSAINIMRAKELIAAGDMTPAGERAFAARRDDRSAIYAYEQRKAPQFDAAQATRFRANAKAWTFFQAQPPGYQRLTTFWVTSAKREETRAKRLATLIRDSAAGRRIRGLERPKPRAKPRRKR